MQPLHGDRIKRDNKDNSFGDFPSGPVVKTALPKQGVRGQYLFGELRSHKPFCVYTKNKKETRQKAAHIFTFSGH